MKVITAKIKPVEIEMVDIQGNKKIYRSEYLPLSKSERLVDLSFEQGKNPYAQLCEQMAVIFGGTPDDYKCYDLDMINEAITYFNEERKNPTPAQ